MRNMKTKSSTFGLMPVSVSLSVSDFQGDSADNLKIDWVPIDYENLYRQG